MNDHRHLVVGLGELLWDVFPHERKMGGAPANFAYHVSLLGDLGLPLSRVGADAAGNDLVQGLSEAGLDTAHIQVDAEHPTGTVEVRLDESGQPNYGITEGVAWDYLEWTDRWRSVAQQADAVCFGTLAQRSRQSRDTIRRFLHHLRPGKVVRLFDVNLRQNYFNFDVLDESIRVSDIVKLNSDELPIVVETLGLGRHESLQDKARALLRKYALDLVCITRGSGGSLLVTAKATSEHPGCPVVMADPVGAGDAFGAALVHHFMRGSGLDRMNEAANRMGAWVASQVGAMPAAEDRVLTEVIAP